MEQGAGLRRIGQKGAEQAMEAARLRGWHAAGAILAGCLVFAWGATAAGVHPMDQLPRGQDLVDRATAQIERRTDRLLAVAADRDALYRGVRALSGWEEGFARDSIAARYYLEGPEGLLIRDGIADSLVARLHPVLSAYVKNHPDEVLDPARQAFELATASFPLPPGRFLGFHFVELALLLGAQADTILTVLARQEGAPPPAGTQDGFLRRLWDLGQLYQQTHSLSGEKYFSTIVQEDWIFKRLRCQKCGQRSFKTTKEYTGMKDDMSGRCAELLYGAGKDTTSMADRIACRHWGHVFQVACTACSDTLTFSVPLPFYRLMQLNQALGTEELPDVTPYLKPRLKEEEDKGK